MSVPQVATNPFAQNAPAPVIAPDIVVINDGRPVESVSKQNKMASLGKVAAMVLAPLIAGVVIGKISAGAGQYNQVIEDAAPIRDDVKTIRRGLTDLQATLESGKKGGKFAPGDEKLTAALGALEDLQGNYELVFGSSMYHLDPLISREIFTFYSDIQALNAKRKEHLRAANLEAKALKDGALKFQNLSAVPYAGLLDIPSADDAAAGKPVSFKLVQLGGPVCEGDTKPNPEGCGGAAPSGMAYRDDEAAGSWKVDKLADAAEAGVPTKRIVMLDPSNPLVKQVLTGGEATLAELSYTKRVEELATLTEQMLATGKKIETALNEKANEGGKFSFFL